jgi:hypothetical protein
LLTIRSIDELVKQAVKLREESGLRWLFRGLPQADWDLVASVHRHYGQREERYLSHEFRARAGVRHAHRPRYDDRADWLSLMQHYGLPTRLLDWTHSPLTAAFFAAQRTMRHFSPRDEAPLDAAVWALCPGELNRAQGLEPYIYPLNSRELEPLVNAAFFPFNSPIEVAAAMAVETDVRMQVQRGAFTIHGTGQPLSHVCSLGIEIEALGVSLADLFPDLGSLARDLAASVPSISW